MEWVVLLSEMKHHWLHQEQGGIPASSGTGVYGRVRHGMIEQLAGKSRAGAKLAWFGLDFGWTGASWGCWGQGWTS